IRWELLADPQRRRYLRWLRRHRRRLWGRDFDDGDGAVVDRLFKLVNESGDPYLVARVMGHLGRAQNDEQALKMMHETLSIREPAGREGRMTFHVYENWQADGHQGKIHVSDCSHCNF